MSAKGWILAAVVFGSLILFLGWRAQEREEACTFAGGHIVTLYKSSLCVDAEGRVIEP